MALTVLQDTGCAVCRRTADALAGLDWLHALRFPGVRGDISLPDGSLLTRAQQLEELHVIDSRGGVERGFFAFRRIAAEVPLLWALVPFLYMPGAALVGEPTYRWIARHRGALGWLLRAG